MKKLFILIFLLLAAQINYAQVDFSEVEFDEISQLNIVIHWGDLTINGTKSAPEMKATHTDQKKQPKVLKLSERSVYVKTSRNGSELNVEVRSPKGFESVDLDLKVPQDLFVNVRLLRGGNIEIKGLNNGLELDHRNGSVVLRRIGGYAIVNAANGSIDADFSRLDSKRAISLITMNGEVRMRFPRTIARDVQLISRRSGYIRSDFVLDTEQKVYYEEVLPTDTTYAVDPINIKSPIGKGGALIFASTERGPIYFLSK